MGKVKFKRIREFGSLSDYSGAPEFNLIDWNGYEKYDIRRWSEDGEPYKGITVDEDELEDLLDILLSAIGYKKSSTPKYVIPCGKTTAKIYEDFGSFAVSGNMEKQVTYTDWGYGCKYDLRPWAEGFSACGKGISLDADECTKLIDLIREELGIENNQYGISFEDFVIRSNIFRCNKNHELESIQALISVLKYNGEVSNEIVSAGFCKHCNCYFILERDYLRLRNIGLPLCRQITEKAYRENGDEIFNGEGLNPQSVLNQIGYNVNSNEDLSSKQRQDILSFAVETGLYTPSGICSFLDWLIDKNSRVTNRDMNDAIRKWTEDRNYIARYKIGTRPMKGVKSLKGRSVR